MKYQGFKRTALQEVCYTKHQGGESNTSGFLEFLRKAVHSNVSFRPHYRFLAFYFFEMASPAIDREKEKNGNETKKRELVELS